MPLSPSLDSGISSPDDYQRGKYFDFTGAEQGSGSGSDGEFRDFDQSFDQDVTFTTQYSGYQENADPFMELDINSSSSESPTKPLPDDFSSELYGMQELLAHISLEERPTASTLGRTPSSHRLPVFDDMLNAKSDSSLLPSHEHPANSFGFFTVA